MKSNARTQLGSDRLFEAFTLTMYVLISSIASIAAGLLIFSVTFELMAAAQHSRHMVVGISFVTASFTIFAFSLGLLRNHLD